MRKVLSLAIAALGAGIISSCSGDEMFTPDIPHNDLQSVREISFNDPFIGKVQSRATIDRTNFQQQTLSVFADRQIVGEDSWTTAIGSNTLSFANSRWSLATPVKWYYANNYRFSAAYPSTAGFTYSDGKIRLGEVSAVEDEASGTDYLVSDPVAISDVTDEIINNGVSLTMRHIMSKFQFVVKNLGTSNIHITSATIHLPKSGVKASYAQTAEAGNRLDGTWTWKDYANPEVYDAAAMDGKSFISDQEIEPTKTLSSGEYFIAPKEGLNLFFDISYELIDDDGDVIKSVNVEKRQFQMSMLSGVFSKAILEIDMDGFIRNITFSTVSLDNYENSEFSDLAEKKDGHGFVDLGLPSGIKWATANIGADTETDAGLYFWWGDIEGHLASERYDFSENNRTIITYNKPKEWLVEHGVITGDGILTDEYDAARQHWGGNWRMPSEKDLKELCDYCAWNWASKNGKTGIRISGPNGNTLFLPSTGSITSTGLSGVNYGGSYWSSSLSDEYWSYGNRISFGETAKTITGAFRYCGMTVRPVCD